MYVLHMLTKQREYTNTLNKMTTKETTSCRKKLKKKKTETFYVNKSENLDEMATSSRKHNLPKLTTAEKKKKKKLHKTEPGPEGFTEQSH